MMRLITSMWMFWVPARLVWGCLHSCSSNHECFHRVRTADTQTQKGACSRPVQQSSPVFSQTSTDSQQYLAAMHRIRLAVQGQDPILASATSQPKPRKVGLWDCTSQASLDYDAVNCTEVVIAWLQCICILGNDMLQKVVCSIAPERISTLM